MGHNRVVVYPDWCKGCGICAAFCPSEVLAVGPDGKARVVDETACVNCGFCEVHCPDFAIMVIPEDAGADAGGQGRQPPPEALDSGSGGDQGEGRS